MGLVPPPSRPRGRRARFWGARDGDVVRAIATATVVREWRGRRRPRIPAAYGRGRYGDEGGGVWSVLRLRIWLIITAKLCRFRN